MNKLLCSSDMRYARHGLRRMYLSSGEDEKALVKLLATPGSTVKDSKKARTWCAPPLLVKESRGGFFARLLRHTFLRGRYRRPWIAAHHLAAHGVGVAQPVAFVETGLLGIIARATMVSEYLDGFRDVERFLIARVQQGAGQDTVAGFLERLADAVNTLATSGAYHADLSGKNIYTKDGVDFRFIDLDAVSLDTAYDDALRLKNHIQLYDSFCDMLNDTMLVPFITRMLSEQDPRVWMPKVRAGQEARRLRIEERWTKEGKPYRKAGQAK